MYRFGTNAFIINSPKGKNSAAVNVVLPKRKKFVPPFRLQYNYNLAV